MTKIKPMLPYLIANIIAFYLLPLFMKDTGSAMLILLVVTPLVCFLSSLFYGAKHSFNWLYPIIIAVLFIPTIFIFYNHTAWVYVLEFAIIALVGNFIGKLCKKK